MAARCPPLSGGVRKYAEAPRQGGEGRQGERQGIARPGWLAAIPSPPGRGEEDGDEAGRRAGWQTVEALPCCLLVDRWRDGGEVWRWHRPEPDGVAALRSPWAMLRAGEVVSAGDGVDV